ncbi:MAG: hypothetical protein ABH950_03115 [Candidatus Altiarchaeota archaeon]
MVKIKKIWFVTLHGHVIDTGFGNTLRDIDTVGAKFLDIQIKLPTENFDENPSTVEMRLLIETEKTGQRLREKLTEIRELKKVEIFIKEESEEI